MPQAMPLVQVHTKYICVHKSMYWVCTQVQVHTKYILVHIWVCTEYILSTYSVQGYACCIPRLWRSSDVEVLQLSLLWSTNSVHTWYGTLLHWYTTCYSTELLVLLCTGTYLLVMQFMILRISSFLFGTQYIQICTGLITVQIWMYWDWVPNRNEEILRLWHALQGGMYQCRALAEQKVLY